MRGEEDRFDAYRIYLLAMLVVIYSCNFIDRIILSVVAQDIKRELALTDLQVGLLGGLAFAIFYSTVSLPIARLAERKSRVAIISVSLAVWSLCTALGAFAQNFTHLFLSRMGVGIGEAGFLAPAQSLLADEFSPKRRATAISILSAGPALGQMFGGIVGGYLAFTYGWRTALLLVGLPGAALAFLGWFTLREPVRGRFDAEKSSADVPSLWHVLAVVFTRPPIALISLTAILGQLAAFGLFPFLPSFFMRQFEVSSAEAGMAAGLIAGIGGTCGALVGGPLSDRLGRRDPRLSLALPSIAFLLAGPLLILGLSRSTLGAATLVLICLDVAKYVYVGPAFGAVHNLIGPRERASVIAIIYLLATLIGIALGPALVGAISDHFAAAAYGTGFATDCVTHATPTTACAAASVKGLRLAMMSAGGIYVLTAAAMIAAAFTLPRRSSGDTPALAQS